MDALTHAIESYVSLAATPLTDMHALKAIELIAQNLRRAVADRGDMEANTNMAMASMIAGLAFSNAILGATHAMTHQVDGLIDQHHGETNAAILPHVMEFNLPACPERFRRDRRQPWARTSRDWTSWRRQRRSIEAVELADRGDRTGQGARPDRPERGVHPASEPQCDEGRLPDDQPPQRHHQGD